jgi:hypothetical protein
MIPNIRPGNWEKLAGKNYNAAACLSPTVNEI